MVKQRYIQALFEEYMEIFPAVGIVGPRQVGKTTLVKNLSWGKNKIYLDLEKASDRAKLSDVELFFTNHQDSTVILDEIQLMPELFEELRSSIDEDRRPGRFILLGSASPDLIRSSADSLAGRIGYIELTPFTMKEILIEEMERLWMRGGYPLSFLASTERVSNLWRENFIKTYIERDLGLLGLNTDPKLVERFWMMLAHVQGSLWNGDNFARALGVTRPTVSRYLEFLEGSFMVRILQPYHRNVKKRLVKSPKVYIRDTGLLHALAGVKSYDELINQLLIGASWETFVIEQVINLLGSDYQYYFYRTHQGAECDLLLVKSGKVEWAIEIKNTLSPKISKGFLISMEDTKAANGAVISRVKEGYPLKGGVRNYSLLEFCEDIKKKYNETEGN
ncbi:ATP-binding protein [Cyclobacterium plantarum]|uniref:ATP-binding protein n=1 Tax=Cyclobacterium plantarum TaxID=2716263 RepID=A0ABX0HFU0_9BACT|nr:ATP-binding protein [Cyclobacterium plantarum]NHE59017.1 ATP-binding protein [Cyclobacterium plantarum]